ncbi:MAG: DUF2147 domain-containing protein [Pseudomonadota bacterium]
MPLAPSPPRSRPTQTLRARLSSALVGAAAVASTSALAAVPAKAASVEGLWFDDSGKGAVRISRCGQALCGRIAWLQSPTDARGQPLTDGNNPKQSRRSRPICGLQVIGRVAPVGSNAWDNGWIYDPKTGKSYDVAITLKSRNRLEVTGYLGVKFLSRTIVWKRAPSTLPTCETTSS